MVVIPGAFGTLSTQDIRAPRCASVKLLDRWPFEQCDDLYYEVLVCVPYCHGVHIYLRLRQLRFAA